MTDHQRDANSSLMNSPEAVASSDDVMFSRVISGINESKTFYEATNKCFCILKDCLDCDAIGLRTRSGEDYPYAFAEGFPDSFFPGENTLLQRDRQGDFCRDHTGQPALKCLCGMVLQGQQSHDYPVLTPNGSFWTNNLPQFLEDYTGADSSVQPTNPCPTAGFLSVALIPVRSQQQMHGLLQLCYRHTDAFTEERIRTLEHIALCLGGAFQRLRDIQRLSEDQAKYRELVEGLNEIIYCLDLSGTITYISPVVHNVLGYFGEELTGSPFSGLICADEEGEKFWAHAMKCLQPEYEMQVRHKSGRMVWMRISNLPMFEGGMVVGIRGIMVDISQKKLAEEEYRCLFNEMLNAFSLHEMIFDEDGNPVDYRFLLVNPAFERMTGLRSQDVLGKTVLEVLPCTEKFWFDTYGRVVSTNQSIEFEGYSSALHKHFKITAFPHGEKQFACMFNNITAQVNAEKELRLSEALHKSFLETMPIPVFCKDISGRYTRVNRSLCEFYHQPPEAFIGRQAHDIASAELAAIYTQNDRLVLESRMPQVYESMIVDFAGNVHDVVFHKAALLDEEGNANGIIGAIMDITEQKRAARALKESEERMTLALQGADLGMWDWNIRTGEIRINSRWAEMLGYLPDEIHPTVTIWDKMIHPDDFAHAQHLLREHFNGKTEGFEAEMRVRHKAGHWIWIIDKGRVIKRDREGRPLRACGTHLDITERKNLEHEANLRREQLIHADKLSTIGTLVACIMHEINNPIGVLSLNIPSLRMIWQQILPILDDVAEKAPDLRIGKASYEKTRQNIEIMMEGITGSCERIRRIVKSLKDFARPDQLESSGDLKLNELVRGAVQFLEHHIQKSTRHFSLLLQDDLPVIPRGYPGRIEQVIINVLMNATQALTSPEQGIRVQTGFERDSGLAFIQVEDEGCGITPENMAQISTPFFTTKRSSGGSGLGLSICNTILKEHGGRLEISSPGCAGAIVRILLPMDSSRSAIHNKVTA